MPAAFVGLQVIQHGGVAAEGSGGEERVVGRQDEVAAGCGGLDLHELSGWREVLIVAADQLEAEQIVAGDETLDLVEDGETDRRG